MFIRCLYSSARGVATLVCTLVAGACTGSSDGHSSIEEYAHALSPDAEVSAHVYHYDSPTGGLTQVMLDFVGRGCGSGSASWYDYDIDVELRWIDSATLEVSYPYGIRFRHNASGDLLGCLDRLVRVVMAPRGITDFDGGTYAKPIETGHTRSPNRGISAYTFRYDSPQGGITQVIVHFLDKSGCADSAVTFYDNAIDLQLNSIDTATLEVRYPDGQRYDHPPWGTTVRCVEHTVQVRMQPVVSVPGSLGLQR